MRELVVKYLSKGVSRRGFVTGWIQRPAIQMMGRGELEQVRDLLQLCCFRWPGQRALRKT